MKNTVFATIDNAEIWKEQFKKTNEELTYYKNLCQKQERHIAELKKAINVITR